MTHAPLLIGHRGAPGHRPEHTASSYRLAFEQGVDAVEPDLVVSRDGVLVIRHENEISGTTDVADRPEFAERFTTKTIDGVTLSGWFAEDFDWHELATLRCRERIADLRPENTAFDGEEPMLRFEDLLALVDEASEAQAREIGVVIELKHVHFLRQQGHDLVALMLAELERTGWARKSERLTVECFELGALDRARETGFSAQLIFLLEHAGAPADEVAVLGARAKSYAWYRSNEGLDLLLSRVHGISVSKRDLMRVNVAGKAIGATDLVARAHARGLTVFTWTLRPENRFLVPGFRSSRSGAEWGDWREEWRLILSTGVDGVFLDHPDLLSQVLPRV